MRVKPGILGVVLAGGNARRLGGADKGLIPLAGKPMLAHIIERFRPQVGRLILNANGDPARFSQFQLDVVPDRPVYVGQGPLSGFLAAMDWATRHAPEETAIVTVTTDVPFLPLDLVGRLSQAGQDKPAIAASGGRTHPTIGLWPISLKAAVVDALNSGRRGLHAFAEHHEAIAISFPFSDSEGRTVDPFFNANTPEDFAAARALLTGQK